MFCTIKVLAALVACHVPEQYYQEKTAVQVAGGGKTKVTKNAVCTELIKTTTMKDNILKIYTGSEVPVRLLKGLLEENNIYSIIKDEFQSSISAGYVKGVPSAIDIYIKQSDLEKAKPIIADFIKNNN